MNEPKLQIAQCTKTGDLKSIFEVATGAECGCVVPGLNLPVVAKNKGKKPNQFVQRGQRVAHFAVAKGHDAQKALESALHHLAKAVFAQRLELFVPPLRMSPNFDDKLQGALFELYPESWNEDLRDWVFDETFRVALDKMEKKSSPRIFKFDRVESEVLFQSSLGEFRADSVGSIQRTKLVVEFKVTHPVDDEKKERIRSLGYSCLEVDLSDFHQIDESGKVNFEGMSQLLKGKGGAHFEWIHNERLPRLEETVIEEALRSARRMIKNKVAKDKRERDYGFFQGRKEVGYNAIKVYGNSSNSILLGHTIYPDGKTVYCPDRGGTRTSATECLGCKFFGEHHYFLDKKTETQVQLALCGFKNGVRTNTWRDLRESFEKES